MLTSRAGWACLPLAGVMLLSVCVAACDGSGALQPPSRSPDITGVITEVQSQTSGVRILIEEKPGVWGPGPEVGGAKMYLTVTEGTSIFIQAGSSWRMGSQEDLKTGTRASAWASGAVLDSYPRQGQAGVVAITS